MNEIVIDVQLSNNLMDWSTLFGWHAPILVLVIFNIISQSR